MNIEKVLDLAVQADPATVEVLGEIGGRSFIAANGIRPQYIQKFAELIVKECVSLCEDVKVQHRQYRMEETDFGMKNIYAEGEATCDVLQHKMKKHFGVEE
jgi:hypothetical protein